MSHTGSAPTYPSNPGPAPFGAAPAGVLRQRAGRRPSPRFGISIAAAGAVLTVVGALVLAGHHLIADNGDVNRTPGILVGLVLVIGGYALAAWARTGPLGAAGVTATLIALPALIFFIGISLHRSDPVPLSAMFGVSAAAWLIAYLVGPTRGHSVYLGSAALAAWLFVLDQVEDFVSIPQRYLGSTFGADAGGLGAHSVSLTKLGAVSLVFAVGFFIIGGVLDRRQMPGAATPLVLAGLVTLVAAFGLLANKLGETGTGLLLILAGLIIALLGAVSERRVTTWAGGVGVFYGVGYVIDKAAHGAVPIGTALLVVGLAVVLVAYTISVVWHEPVETLPQPSTFALNRPAGAEPPPSAGWPPPGPSGWAPPPPPPPSGPPPPDPNWGPPQPGSYSG